MTKNADGSAMQQIVIPNGTRLGYTMYFGAEQAANQGKLARWARSVTKADQIDLDAAAMLANANKQVVAAAHPLNPNALRGSAVYQGNTVAKEGQEASETIEVNLGSMHPDVRWVTLAATCFGSLTGLANLSVLGFRLVDLDSEQVFMDSLRSIENEATAAIFGRLTRTPNGWTMTQTDDTVTVPTTIRNEKAKWRSLAEAMRVALR